MKTVGDVIQSIILTRAMQYFARQDTTENREKRALAMEPVWSAIAQEQGVSVGEARFLPPETPLGPKAEEAFRNYLQHG